MKKKPEKTRSEYDFDYSKAVRGKYHKRLLAEKSSIIVLEPDIAQVFQLFKGGEYRVEVAS